MIFKKTLKWRPSKTSDKTSTKKHFPVYWKKPTKKQPTIFCLFDESPCLKTSVWILWIYETWGSEFSSYEIELQKQVTQNDVTLRVTNTKIFTEIFLWSY